MRHERSAMQANQRKRGCDDAASTVLGVTGVAVLDPQEASWGANLGIQGPVLDPHEASKRPSWTSKTTPSFENATTRRLELYNPYRITRKHIIP